MDPITTASAIENKLESLALAITDRHFSLHPELEKKYGPIGRQKCHEDARYHLSYLVQALTTELPSLFHDYVGWAKVMLLTRGVPENDLIDNLKVITKVIEEQLPSDQSKIAEEYISKGLEKLSSVPNALPTHLDSKENLGELALAFLHLLLQGERRKASKLILDAVESGVSVKDIYLYVFQRSQHEVGRLWQENKLSVAQEHYCTAATQLIMSQLYPQIFMRESNGKTLVATCVSGDLHEIGVRMISDFFEMEGWDTFYLGANVPPQSIIDSLIKRHASVLAISATMTYHVRHVIQLVQAVRNNPSTQDIKIIVGGYPFNLEPELWKKVGADGFAQNAEDALTLAKTLQ